MIVPPKGIFVPTANMYAEDGGINDAEMCRYYKFLADSSLTGLFLNGSTGDASKLTRAEKKHIVELGKQSVGDRMYLLAGAIEGSLDEAIRVANDAAEAGANAVVGAVPYYFKHSQKNIITFFESLANASPLPVFLYDIPAFTTGMEYETVVTLSKHPNICGMKDSSRNFVRFEQFIHAIKSVRPDFRLYIGTEELLLVTLMMGGDGATIATGGIDPENIMGLYNAFNKGDIETARKIQLKLLPQIAGYFSSADFPDGFRDAVRKLGFAVGKDRL